MSKRNNINKEEKAGYKEGFKSTALFGGVQVYSILIRVIKSKFIAMLLGAGGMGISNLLHSTTDLVSVATNCGLRTSGVRTVADAYTKHDTQQIAQVTAVVRKLITITGLIGLLVVALLAPLWSKFAFGNSDYIWPFVFVSLVVLLDQKANGENVVLQGMRQRQSLAKANIIGQTLGLFISVPLYFFFGIKAIALVLVVSSVSNYCIALYFSHKSGVERAKVTLVEIKEIGLPVVKLGFFLSLQAMLQQLCTYLVRIFVSNMGGLEQVGLYSAGTAILTTYLGLVFTAMATDYFPRLAGAKNNDELNTMVKQQTELSLLLLAPIIVAFIIFIKPLIILLYSSDFLPVEKMLYWGMAATLFKAMAWGLSYTLLAKADSKVFFRNELIAMMCTFTFNLVGYYYWGLTGFGISMVITYILYLVQMLIVVKKFFGITYDSSVWLLFLKLSVPLVASLLVINYCSEFWSYVLGCLILGATMVYVYKELDRRMDIKSMLCHIIKK